MGAGDYDPRADLDAAIGLLAQVMAEDVRDARDRRREKASKSMKAHIDKKRKEEEVLEASCESVLVQAVKVKGGLALKLQPTHAGVPDRLVLMPGGRSFLVELKQDNGTLSKAQREWHRRSALMGHTVTVLKGADQVREWVSEL